MANDPLAFRAILEEYPQDLLRLLVVGRRLKRALALFVGHHGADLELDDEPLVLEHLRDLLLEHGPGHIDGRSLIAVAVANARQHVGDRISHHVVALRVNSGAWRVVVEPHHSTTHQSPLTSLLSSHPGSNPWSPCHGSKCGTRRICDRRRGPGRTAGSACGCGSCRAAASWSWRDLSCSPPTA